ncbi:hypothetical protein EUGRSUZ_E01493 [Eucalyptus grandis]|uniref:Uncharacterized protein n=2 Tax=Eucalyptus grandis TaxID=71139 RepID=A0ACC3KUI8_EUCGR|nr:hypothetical protein EUGRSUZ_E01493 [Eucalyptus grandis]
MREERKRKRSISTNIAPFFDRPSGNTEEDRKGANSRSWARVYYERGGTAKEMKDGLTHFRIDEKREAEGACVTSSSSSPAEATRWSEAAELDGASAATRPDGAEMG